ncbi:hypothetical protein HIM_11574 [Hirsutella minnesotensis 3608]|uniref:DUF6570 domain-containing protein n=1 Tax=Hirsutella minnesotensis 3608 TaxID=1043627 RepID=A0A0F7ZFF1_9HYPO|nr:hypothetical protein HIM_11574 [Hirsutella minnesotensis 3608]
MCGRSEYAPSSGLVASGGGVLKKMSRARHHTAAAGDVPGIRSKKRPTLRPIQPKDTIFQDPRRTAQLAASIAWGLPKLRRGPVRRPKAEVGVDGGAAEPASAWLSEKGQPQRRGKRDRLPSGDERPRKQVRSGIGSQRRRELQAEDLGSVLRFLEEDFAIKERLSNDQTWCTPIPGVDGARFLSGVSRCEHVADTDVHGVLPQVYERRVEGDYMGSMAVKLRAEGRPLTIFMSELLCGGRELATKVLPNPLVRVMDEIHVSWQGSEKPGPSDLSSLLSVRRRVVERALVWLKKNNPHYAEIEIDVPEMESWGAPPHGVPSLVYDRMERNEPSAWEKTRTAQVVPPTERGVDDEGSVEIEEILTALHQGEDSSRCETDRRGENEAYECRRESDAEPDQTVKPINEVTSSGMFALDGPPDVADADKLRFVCDAVGEGARNCHRGPRTWVGSSTEGRRGHVDGSEPYVHDLDQEGYCVVQGERSVTSDISSVIDNPEQFSAAFDEEANFCAGATQIHTHSPTCVKYSLGKKRPKGGLCRFGAPWRLVEKTAFTPEGLLQIRRTHPMVNRWNKAIAVGLRHNHDISFIATQRKTMALVYYVTNYATKVEDPTWKRVAVAAELLPVLSGGGQPVAGEHAGGDSVADDDGTKNKTRQFLMRVANRIFTERPLSQVEVVAHLLGYPSEFTNSSAWGYLNVSVLYWYVFRRWRHLRRESGTADVESLMDESIVVEEAGQRISSAEAYHHRGDVLRGLCLYDYVSLVRLQRVGKDGGSGAWGEVPFEIGWAPGKRWVQVLRRPGKHAVVCFDGYLSKAFDQDDEGSCHHRAAVQHLALFVPWESFLGEERGDINEIWARARELLPPRISCLVDNVQLLQRSAEDARRDAKQWTASSGGEDHTDAHVEEAGGGEADEETESAYQSSNVGNATRLIDVIRSAADANQITAGSPELTTMTQKLCRFQQSAISSTAELAATAMLERGERRINMPGRVFSGAVVPPQDQVKAIKSQQVYASKERVKMIQGIQNIAATHGTDRRAAARSVLTGFGDGDMQMTAADLEETVGDAEPSVEVHLGPSTTFLETGKELVARLTLNQKQAIAFLILCRQLDLIHCGGKEGDVGQLCQFVGGEGETGKSRVIEALVELFARNRLLITATSGTAAARINGITIHSACGFCKDQGTGANTAKDLDGARMPKRAHRFVHGQSRMDWQEEMIDKRPDPMPAETAVAAKRRHQKRAAVHGGLCMHGLQGAGGDARTSGAGVARHEDDDCQRSCRALAVRPVQLVRAAIAVPDARRHHARVKGTGERSGGEPGSGGDDCGTGQTGEAERGDCARGLELVGRRFPSG